MINVPPRALSGERSKEGGGFIQGTISVLIWWNWKIQYKAVKMAGSRA